MLILGESGTGKELVARAIHENSERKRGPFVAVNCATLTENLLESELFGHERGAFTGAVAQRRGKLGLADGGTIFLDEVGELALPLQAKLLRALQEREVERLGGKRPIPVDIRVVAATNRDLEEAVKAGTFRKDLYYRLNVVSVHLPPLRERRDDLVLLIRHFAQLKAKEMGIPEKILKPEAVDALLSYPWPGNVRELENLIERLLVLCESQTIGFQDLPEQVRRTEQDPGSIKDQVLQGRKSLGTAVDEFERENRWQLRQQEIVRRIDRDGEAFLRFFVDHDGMTRVRFIEPDEVVTPAEFASDPSASFGIRTEADDVETVLGYWVDSEFVDAHEVQHLAEHELGARRVAQLFGGDAPPHQSLDAVVGVDVR